MLVPTPAVNTCSVWFDIRMVSLSSAYRVLITCVRRRSSHSVCPRSCISSITSNPGWLMSFRTYSSDSTELVRYASFTLMKKSIAVMYRARVFHRSIYSYMQSQAIFVLPVPLWPIILMITPLCNCPMISAFLASHLLPLASAVFSALNLSGTPDLSVSAFRRKYRSRASLSFARS